MKKIAFYLPRILVLILAAFFGIFIIEDLGSGFFLWDTAMHSTATIIILAATIVAWKWPKIGGWIFVAMGIFFCFFFHPFLWGLNLGLVPLAIGMLFLAEGYNE